MSRFTDEEDVGERGLWEENRRVDKEGGGENLQKTEHLFSKTIKTQTNIGLN